MSTPAITGDDIDEIDVLVESRAQPRSVGQLPHLVRESFVLVRASAPGRFGALIGLQLTAAAASALLVYLGKRSFDAILDRRADTDTLGRALPLLLAVVVVSAVAEMIAAVLGQQLRLLAEILQRATWERVLETTERLDLEAFEDASFFDQVQRVRANALLRPFELVTGLVGGRPLRSTRRAAHDLFERIRTLFAGRSVLLIAHRFSSVRSADRIYVLDAGRERGSHDELMTLGGVYAELFTLQAAAYLQN